jgi:hypothetical protein
MVQRTGRAAGFAFGVHPHMLRHSTGYKLANDGQDTRSLAHYWTPEFAIDGPVHGAGAGSVQGVLAALTPPVDTRLHGTDSTKIRTAP